jgi:hypothetical protein
MVFSRSQRTEEEKGAEEEKEEEKGSEAFVW